MALPAAPYGIARVVTVLITMGIWFCVLSITGFIFSGGVNVTHATPEVMGNVAGMVLPFVPLFTAQGVLTGMMDGLMQARFVAPSDAISGELRGRNPWLVGLVLAFLVGAPAGLLGHTWASALPSDTLTPGAFALQLASRGVLVCGLAAAIISGAPFLHELRVDRARRRFAGDARAYLWTRHVWPNVLVNLVINFALAYALVPGTLSDPATVAPASMVVGDTLVTCVVLCVLIGAGAATQARVERAWGIAPEPSSAAHPSVARALVPKLVAGAMLTIAVGLTLWLTGSPGLRALPWAVFRGLVFGAYAGWIAHDVALAKLAANR